MIVNFWTLKNNDTAHVNNQAQYKSSHINHRILPFANASAVWHLIIRLYCKKDVHIIIGIAYDIKLYIS